MSDADLHHPIVRAAVGKRHRPPYFRRAFPGIRRPAARDLRVTALGLVGALAQRRRVGDEVLAPGLDVVPAPAGGQQPRRHRARSRVGDNVVGAIVGEGWALGRLGWENRAQPLQRPARAVGRARPRIRRPASRRSSHRHRRSAPSGGAIRSTSIYDGEVFDARLEPDGWDRPGFDDTAGARSRSSTGHWKH